LITALADNRATGYMGRHESTPRTAKWQYD
jgi:hypothetical protein